MDDVITCNKKYVLWNTGICPIASKVGHVTLATPPLGSFIVPYIVIIIITCFIRCWQKAAKYNNQVGLIHIKLDKTIHSLQMK